MINFANFIEAEAMSKQIVVTGATGLIGSHLVRALSERGDHVLVFTRSPGSAQSEIPFAAGYIKWTPEESSDRWEKYIDGADAVIHLAGAPVMARRWSGEYKAQILGSRQIGTRQIVHAIKNSTKKPEVFVCASAIGIYGTYEGGTFTEKSEAGNDFLATVCKIWEKEASEAEGLGVRRVSVRLGIVLEKSGGALGKMITPYRFFIGGPLGSGKQGFPWIHIDDAVGIFLKAIDDRSIKGPLNAVAPESITMQEFAEALGKVLHRPSAFKVPKIALRIIAGEGAETIYKTPKVIPEVLLKNGYEFKYKTAEAALKNILDKK